MSVAQTVVAALGSDPGSEPFSPQDCQCHIDAL